MEPLVERVLVKDRANFCDYFEPTTAAVGPSEGPSPADLLKAAQDLFK
jgi:hypothetical protein